MQQGTAAILTVKELSAAKSRFTSMAPALRHRLVELMLVNTAQALSGPHDELIVVSGEPGISRLLVAYGISATVIDDPGEGLNAAFRLGEEYARRSGHARVAAWMADLPALRPESVLHALSRCSPGPGRWFVRDAAGVGTAALITDGPPLDPQFGVDSASRHLASGAIELPATPDARRDVDDAADLAAAIALGLTEPVAALVTGSGPGQHRSGYVAAGIRSDGGELSGYEVILTSGVRKPVSTSAVGREYSSLRAGQRVQLVLSGAGTITHLWI